MGVQTGAGKVNADGKGNIVRGRGGCKWICDGARQPEWKVYTYTYGYITGICIYIYKFACIEP